MCRRQAIHLCWLGALLMLTACSNGRGSLQEESSPPPSGTANPPPSAPPPSGVAFSIGGEVTGLIGSGLTLQLNGSDDLPITSNGVFSFATRLPSGSTYAVTIRTSPSNPIQSCSVANGSGTLTSSDISSVRIACGGTETFSVGGEVGSLLGSGLVLQNNGGDDIGIDSSGAFKFPVELARGASYNVKVRTQPTAPDQACSVRNGTGTIANSDITNVLVTCAMSEFTIGGTVSGLSGSGLILLNNGNDEVEIDSNGTFTFPDTLPTGAQYSVTVGSQSTNQSQTCRVSNGSGTVGTMNVTSVRVTCTAAEFGIGGHVSHLRGSGLVLQNNGGDHLRIASNGRYRFVTTMQSGASYNITVATQPRDPRQTCIVANGSGIVRNADIDNVDIRCEKDRKDDDDDRD